MQPKIFCIGFHKTGTKSLASALRTLGYRVTGPNWTNEADIATTALSRAMAVVGRFDAFQDNPWPMLYREMDKFYPGSKFILTTRDAGDWIASVSRYFAGGSSPMREWIYGHGNPEGHEAAYVHRYEQHNRHVSSYFTNRHGDLLIMDLARGDGWLKLCRFLGAPVPDTSFPTANIGGARYMTGTTMQKRIV